jgi:hypothetical protein
MLFMFVYGLSIQAPAIRWVSVVILVIVFGLGLIIKSTRSDAKFFQELQESRKADFGS